MKYESCAEALPACPSNATDATATVTARTLLNSPVCSTSSSQASLIAVGYRGRYLPAIGQAVKPGFRSKFKGVTSGKSLLPTTRALALAVAMLLVYSTAAAADGSYTACKPPPGTSFVGAARVSCSQIAATAAAAAAAPPEGVVAALIHRGWRPYRAVAVDGSRFNIVALRGRAVLRIRRFGVAPDLDGFAAGREVAFLKSPLTEGGRLPQEAVICTSGFVVQLTGGSLGGLSSEHCASDSLDGVLQRPHLRLRRLATTGLPFGPATRSLGREASFDALMIPLYRSASRTVTAIVDRGISRPPWFVRGVAKATPGRRACLSGSTSGVDVCGRLRGASARTIERFFAQRAGTVVRCTTIISADGDSGGPVYTAPRRDGTVHALGLTTVSVGEDNQMCLTPISPTLERLGARLLIAR